MTRTLLPLAGHCISPRVRRTQVVGLPGKVRRWPDRQGPRRLDTLYTARILPYCVTCVPGIPFRCARSADCVVPHIEEA